LKSLSLQQRDHVFVGPPDDELLVERVISKDHRISRLVIELAAKTM